MNKKHSKIKSAPAPSGRYFGRNEFIDQGASPSGATFFTLPAPNWRRYAVWVLWASVSVLLKAIIIWHRYASLPCYAAYLRQLGQTGRWSSPTESTDFVLLYPTEIFNQLAFLNREWTIAAASTNFFRLMAADGDEVDFVSEY